MKDEIVIRDYSSTWPMDYLRELKGITDLLILDEIVDIQHFGSTSVPGLAAKPVIDIIIGFQSFAVAEQRLTALESLAYEYVEAVSVPGGRLFLKKEPRTRHVHFVEYGTEHWHLPLIFRDYIRVHQQARMDYEALKKQNSQQFRFDRVGYTNAKTNFIHNILAKATGAVHDEPHKEDFS